MNPDNPECNHHHQNESTNHQLVLSAHNPHDYTQQLPCFTSRTQVIHKGRVKKTDLSMFEWVRKKSKFKSF